MCSQKEAVQTQQHIAKFFEKHFCIIKSYRNKSIKHHLTESY